MNIPWTENPAGVFPTTVQGYLNYESSGYVGTKEYLGYNTDAGQKDTSSTFYYNSLGEKIIVKPSEQIAIAIVHYTNQSIDNFYGEKFAQEPFDVTNSGNTGQARNLKITIPWLMWHKNPNGTIGEDFYTDPDGFSSLNLLTPYYIKSLKSADFNKPGIRYYHLWDTFANEDGYPSRIGKVFPDHKIIIIDDDEIIPDTFICFQVQAVNHFLNKKTHMFGGYHRAHRVCMKTASRQATKLGGWTHGPRSASAVRGLEAKVLTL